MFQVILLGAAGYVGSEVLKLLLEDLTCARILCLQRNSPIHSDLLNHPDFPRKATCVFADPNEWREHVNDFCRNAPFPVTCIHYGFSQRSGSQKELERNETTLQKLIEALVEARVRVLMGSSLSVLGPGPFTFVDETAPLAPTTILARSRMNCEQLVSKSGLEHVILRTRFVLGGHDTSTAPGLTKLAKNRILLGTGTQKSSKVEVSDLAKIIRVFAGHAHWENGLYHIAESKPVTFSELVTFLMKSAGEDYSPLVRIPCDPNFLKALARFPNSMARQIVTRLQLFGLDQTCSNRKLIEFLKSSKDEGLSQELLSRF